MPHDIYSPRANSKDKHRPEYHFLPEKNWMNDPNGLIYWQGQYHLFYQYNPNGAFHGTIHWGHAVSSDLVYWQDLPIALAPTIGSPDQDGCFSGCAVDDDGIPTLIYTGVSPQTVCLATSLDGLLTWQKYSGNPVIAEPPPGIQEYAVGDFRDPYVWKEGEYWYLVIGSRSKGEGGLILLYSSSDLHHWDFLQVLISGNLQQQEPIWTGKMWECPNFFTLNGKHVLIISIQASPNQLLYPIYYLGEFQGDQFTPESEQVLVYGGSFYAPQVMHTEDGRVVMFGWLQEGRQVSASLQAGWSGVMSLPIQLSLRSDMSLRLEPVEELRALRHAHWRYVPEMSLGEFLANLQGDQLEIMMNLEVYPTAEFTLTLFCSPNGEEQTRIVYQADHELLRIEADHSKLSSVVDRKIQPAPIVLDDSRQLRLHIFVDHSVLEIFANDTVCLAARVYPTRGDSQGIGFDVHQGDVNIISLDIWKLKSIWKF